VSVILEVAILHVRPHASAEFEAAFAEAQHIIGSMPGYLGHELQRCIEVKDKYVLLVRWRNRAAATARSAAGSPSSRIFASWNQIRKWLRG
jgi:heme-degrading monooxygenase HmoA